jgi:hypothetical protein
VVDLLEILRVYANIYAHAGNVIALSGWKLRNDPSASTNPAVLGVIVGELETLKSHCASLPITLMQISRLIDLLMNDEAMQLVQVSAASISARLVELQSRLEDELSTKLFFTLPLEKRAFFDEPRKGWEEVVTRFPDTVTDIEEMNKCFALSRYAGAVFHSVNAIEGCLLELGTFLKVQDPKSGWTAVSKKLEDVVVKTKYQDLDTAFQAHFPFLEQTNGTVAALKNSWRNKISHAQGKLVLMTSDFSADVTEEIMIATRAFMRRLATEMP